MMVLEGHGLDVAPKSKVANMLFLAAKTTPQLGLKEPAPGIAGMHIGHCVWGCACRA